MTVRDPYTGVETKVRPPRSPLQRWWPAGAIALVAIVVGYFEWHNAQTPAPRPPTAATQTQPQVASSAPRNAPAAGQAPNQDELAQETAVLAKASDQLGGTSNLLIGIAALQAVVLIGQIYLFGQMRRTARKPD